METKSKELCIKCEHRMDKGDDKNSYCTNPKCERYALLSKVHLLAKTDERGRTELIYELAKHVRSTSPIRYHEMITWKTEHIRALVEWYERPEEPEHTLKDFINFCGGHGVKIGVDFAEEGGDESCIVFQWPFGYAVK